MSMHAGPKMTSQHELNTVVLDLLPAQGTWAEEQYLWLTDQSNRLIEFTDGYVEVLPMPTRKHQAISQTLFLAFLAVVRHTGGRIFYAPLRLRIRDDLFREPDSMLLLDANDRRNQDRYWLGADLVVEVVSPDRPERDLVQKRHDYAQAAIPEYWIVDPQREAISVLRLEGNGYVEHGVFERGSQATSALLAGFAVDVSAVFDAD